MVSCLAGYHFVKKYNFSFLFFDNDKVNHSLDMLTLLFVKKYNPFYLRKENVTFTS